MGRVMTTRIATRSHLFVPSSPFVCSFHSSPPLKDNKAHVPITNHNRSYSIEAKKWAVEVEEEEVEEDPTTAEAAVETLKYAKEVQLLEKHFSLKVDSYPIGLLPPPIAIQVLSLSLSV